jgi:demethylmenaquinone methyltransferase/2-methoxy-6-polyprenyl-1,4-benzoquinol methylase
MSRSTSGVSPRSAHAERLFAGLPGTYERMGAVLSFGQDPRWRRFLAARVIRHAGHRPLVLDVATGTAAVARELARRRRDLRIVGLDQSEPMLREGAARVSSEALGDRIRLLVGRGEALPFPDELFDAVTFTYLLRYVEDPPAVLAELARVLKRGGVMAGLEFHVPRAPWSGPWLVYTRAVMPVVGRLVSRPWGEVGAFLGPSISAFYRRHPLEEQLGWWRASGLADVRSRVMSLGGGVVVWGLKGGSR